ncbi:UNVERIFIED_CONTAM: hypothetical protein HDU68_009899, partial [Siphonaria sp. JEL0065]
MHRKKLMIIKMTLLKLQFQASWVGEDTLFQTEMVHSENRWQERLLLYTHLRVES